MLRRAGVSVVLLSACFSKPPAPVRDDDGGVHDDSMRDGAAEMPVDSMLVSTDANPGGCIIHDDFSGALGPCGAWGTQLGTGLLARANSHLESRPGSMAGDAYCKSASLSPAGTTTFQVITPPADNGRYGFVQLVNAGTTYARFELYNDGSLKLNAICAGAFGSTITTYDGTLSWFRFDVFAGGTSEIVIYGSANGVDFQAQIARCNVLSNVSVTANLEIGAGSEGLSSTNAPIVFDSLDVCP